MKKIAFCLVMVLVSSPAWAAVTITCVPGPGDCNFTVSFDASGEDPNLVRGFGLDIDTGDANVVGVQCVNGDYYVYPGSISIDASGAVSEWGSCICSGYSGTQSNNNDPNITIEMVSNYVGEANEPNTSGDLVIITVDAGCEVSVAENVILGGVVMEDPNLDPTVIATGCIVPCGEPDPNCWDAVNECGGQPLGDSNCDGSVNFTDLGRLKVAFFSTWGQPHYDCCSDYNQDCAVNFTDLGILKVNFFTMGHVPATGAQGCAAADDACAP
jgi:hypothetical protein